MKIKQYNEGNYSFISVSNNLGFSITLCDLGASIYSIIFNNKEMTFMPLELSDFFKDNIYHGKTIGRTPNRIKGNKVAIDNKEYYLENNEGVNTLHGGLHGLSTKVFDYEIEEGDDFVNVVFHYMFKDLEDGLPGNTPIQVIYTVYEEKEEVKIEFFAKTDKKTLLALTNHSYFNLGEKDLSTLSLRIKASSYLEVNPSDLLAICQKPVQKCLNFNEFKQITIDIDDPYLLNSKTNGYDHHFYFNEVNPSLNQVSLKSKDIELDIFTDYSGVQIYSDNYEDFKGRGTPELRRRSIAIEPQESHLDLQYLNKDELYHHFIIYRFRRVA